MDKNRPYITINVAMTADGKIDTAYRKGAKISSPDDWERVDRLRACNDAVLVGGKTLLREDPRLTVKSAGLREERVSRGLTPNPIKVGIVTEAVIQPDSKFLLEGGADVILFTTRQTAHEDAEKLRQNGAEVYFVGEQKVDLIKTVEKLWDLGVKRVLVEGGGTLNAALINLGLVDEIQIYLAPMVFGGSAAPTLADGIGLTLENAVHLSLLYVNQLDNGGVLIQYSVKR